MLPFTIQLAREAGGLLRERLADARVESRHAHDVKLDVDRASEALIVDAIRKAYPAHAILGEESARVAGSLEAQAYTWIVDPLDGTCNYARGVPHFAVSIGCFKRGKPYLGVVYDPVRDELFAGGSEWPASLNGQPIRVSTTKAMGQAVAAVGLPGARHDIKRCLALYETFALHAAKVRSAGSAALDIAYVAAGRYDFYIECGLYLWDIAAGLAIVKAAGGHPDYVPARKPYQVDVVCTNHHLHGQALAHYLTLA